MLNRVVLALVFTLSFVSYMTTDLTPSLQLVPLALFALLVFFKVLCSRSVLGAMWSLFELDGIVFVLFLSVLMVAPSIASGSDKSFETALLFSICLVLARLYMAVVPIAEVLDAFFWSGIASVGLFIPLTFTILMQSAMTFARFFAFSFHPNLLAWDLAGYFCVAVWKLMTGDWRIKILAGVLGVLCVGTIFLASSRGAIVGVLAGSVLAGAMAVARAWKEQWKRLLRMGILGGGLVVGFVVITHNLEWTRDIYAVVDQVLSLSTPDRGIDSGMTGRIDTWKKTIRTISDGSWSFGRGIRSSDSIYPMIDNSYLVILYELGVLPLIMITWRFLALLRAFFKGYLYATGQNQRRCCLACNLLMAVLLVTNLAERSLFAVGNPFSLLAFFLFAAPTSFITFSLRASSGAPRLSGRLANWPWSTTEPSC
jgi:O-antigen ligase